MSVKLPTQISAAQSVYRAIKAGHLVQHAPACVVCGVEGKRCSTPRRSWSIVWHHHSYAMDCHLDVVPVCRSCHMLIHTGRVAEPRTGEFRVGDRRKVSRGRAPLERRGVFG